MTFAYLATNYLRILYRHMNLTAEDKTEFFKDSRWSESELMALDTEIPFDEQMLLYRKAIALDEEGLSLRVGTQLHLAAHGPVGHAMSTAEDLRSALFVLCEFMPVRAAMYSIDVEITQDECLLTFDVKAVPDDLIPFFTEAIFATAANSIEHFAGHIGSMSRMMLSYKEPTYAHLYESFFAAPASFNQDRNVIVLDRKLLDLTAPNPHATLHAQSIVHCNVLRQSQENERPQAVAEEVRNLLMTNPGHLWHLDETAQVLNMSSRTLIRRLKDENAKFADLRDEVLKEQTLSLFTSSKISVEAVASVLGFSDTSSFRRAFKRWFGMAPADFLKRRSASN